MAQRSFRKQQYELFERNSFDVKKYTATQQRALSRVGYGKPLAYEVDWFIGLANNNLEQLSEGENLTLQEDFSVLMKAHCDWVNAKLPTHSEMLEVQRIVRHHLSELADKGLTVLPETPIRHCLSYPRRMAILQTLAIGVPVNLPKETPDCMTQHLIGLVSFNNLVYFMGHLLEKVGKLVLRCPHCRNIFLQWRRNQEYCSRSCQSVSVMQRRRAEAKAKAAQIAKGKKRASQPGKGVASHGKKRRD